MSDLIDAVIKDFGDLIPLALFAIMACIVAGLTIWGVVAAGNNVRGVIDRETELQREKKRKEIELIQAQIDYYNNQREKGT